MIALEVVDTMPQIHSYANAVIIIDALLLQLRSQNLVDFAVGSSCVKWPTQVWTLQGINLTSRALILTASGSYYYKMVVNNLRTFEVKITLDIIGCGFTWLAW